MRICASLMLETPFPAKTHFYCDEMLQAINNFLEFSFQRKTEIICCLVSISSLQNNFPVTSSTVPMNRGYTILRCRGFEIKAHVSI